MASPDLRTTDYQPGGRPLTGGKVLAMVLAFFGLIITVNLGILLPNAIGTFRGLETDSAYRVSQEYNQRLAAAAAQQALGWDVGAHVERDAEGIVVAAITTRDRDGAPLSPMDGEVTLARPADRNLDQAMPLTLTGYGTYEARFDGVAAGQWDLVLNFVKDGERVFHSRNRIILK